MTMKNISVLFTTVVGRTKLETSKNFVMTDFTTYSWRIHRLYFTRLISVIDSCQWRAFQLKPYFTITLKPVNGSQYIYGPVPILEKAPYSYTTSTSLITTIPSPISVFQNEVVLLQEGKDRSRDGSSRSRSGHFRSITSTPGINHPTVTRCTNSLSYRSHYNSRINP